ncbi:hypothetical protein GPECTOR_5g267 [Gonium pectorale]|uniref:WW domain-containing protein n=1 Tax=Gonium pectorale TaxID=33097 RepID=A0A150GXU8_GONPE|nr:hypothetical protein GPECTOR_5g267 [Gonium pectorale]|eukprot:KXZ54170.1 hypothetical protein GPECTOR_5g267 [Gonium pectorale]
MKRGSHVSKKARLEADEPPSDPIAAAMEAKHMNASSVEGGGSAPPLFPIATTTITITRVPRQRPQPATAAAASSDGPSGAASRVDAAEAGAADAGSSGGMGALQSLLGYSDAEEESEETDEGGDTAGRQQPAAAWRGPSDASAADRSAAAAEASGGPSTGGAETAQTAPADGGEAAAAAPGAAKASADDMDTELASFMQELEANGLLGETEAGEGKGSGDGGAEQPAADSAAAEATAAAAPGSARPPPAEPVITSLDDSNERADAPNGSGDAEASAVAAAAADDVGAAAAGGEDQAAEQRMLGYLQQAPEWCKCLDTGTDKIYFWNLGSGEVAWELPHGVDPDLLLPAEGAEQAGAQAAAVTEAAAAAGEVPAGTATGAVADKGAEELEAVGPADGRDGEHGDAEMREAEEPAEGNVPAAHAGATPALVPSEGPGSAAAGTAPTTSGVRSAAAGADSPGCADGPPAPDGDPGDIGAGRGLPVAGVAAEGSNRRAGEAQAETQPDPLAANAGCRGTDAAMDVDGGAAAGCGPELAGAGSRAAAAAAAPGREMKGAVAAGAGSLALRVSARDTGTGGVAGGESGGGEDAELLRALTALLLRPPQPHISSVMAALEAEVESAAQAFLQGLPSLVRLAVEAQVRAADWRLLSAQQAAAAASGQPADAVSWAALERHTVSRVKALLESLPAAAAEARWLSAHGPSTTIPAVPAAAAAAAAGSSRQAAQTASHGDVAPLPLPPAGAAHKGGAAPPDSADGGDDVEDMVIEDDDEDGGAAASGSAPPPPLPSAPPPPPPPPEEGLPPLPPGFEATAAAAAYGANAYDAYMSHMYGYAYGMAPPPASTPAGYQALMFANSYLGHVAAVAPGPALAVAPAVAAAAAGYDIAYDAMAAAAAVPDASADAMAAPLAAAATAAPKPKRKEYRAEPVRNPVAAAGGYIPGDEDTPEPPPLRISASPTPPPLDLLSTHPLPPRESSVAPSAAAADAAAAAAAAAKRKAAAAAVAAAGGGAKRSKGLGGRVGAMVQQWSAVQRKLEEEEEENARKAADAEDPDIQERKRQAELERWKWEQQVTGAAQANANFAPLGDWRSRFPKAATQGEGTGGGGPSAATADGAAAKKEKKDKKLKKDKKEKKDKKDKTAATALPAATAATVAAAAQPAVLNFKTRPDLDALSAGLPAGWRAMWDKGSGDVYYGNLTTKVRARRRAASTPKGREGEMRAASGVFRS